MLTVKVLAGLVVVVLATVLIWLTYEDYVKTKKRIEKLNHLDKKLTEILGNFTELRNKHGL